MLNLKLHQFEGPLDLLLQLIEEEKLSISDISISKVTGQFLEYVKTAENIDPVSLADYLHFAAKLILIKSRTLLPVTPDENEEIEGSLENLKRSLEIFGQFKQLAKLLRKLQLRNMQGFTRTLVFEEKISFFPDPSVNTGTLHAVASHLAQGIREITNMPKARIKEAISIQEKIEHIRALIETNMNKSFSDLTQGKDVEESIVIFLAVLELVKMRIVVVDQNELFEEISINRHVV